MGRLHFGEAREGIGDLRGRVEVYLEPRDIWIGVYVDPNAIYVCPLPFVVFRVSRGARWSR